MIQAAGNVTGAALNLTMKRSTSRWLAAMLCAFTLAHPGVAHSQEAEPAPVEAQEAFNGPAYELQWEIDIPLLVVPAMVLLAWPLQDTFAPPHCAPLCDATDLNGMDKVVAGLHDPDWAMVSDIGVGVLLGSAALIPFLDESPGDALNDLVVIAQGARGDLSVEELRKHRGEP